jgi:hypothetical protein
VNDRDLDAEFQRIVAGWDDEAPDPLTDRSVGGSPGISPGETPGMPSGGDPAIAGDVGGSDESTAGGPEGAAVPGKATGVNPAPLPPAGAGGDGAGHASSAASTDVAHGGDLGLPIASTTSHVWRASAPSDAVDDVDALLDEASAARGGEPDDHFVPPSEIELPSAETDPMFWAIVGGLVGGPLLLLYLLFFDRDGSGWWVVTAISMIVVGFVLLVLRGGTERDPFDDGTRV